MTAVDWLDLSLDTPEENLSLDEALLLQADSDNGGPVLRFWESASHFIVLGISNRADVEADLGECLRAGVPVLRRTSGGGAVLQGPGCLNYALVLPVPDEGPLSGLLSTNDHIIGRHAAALSALAPAPVTRAGTSDLAMDGLKFSGNAQRRKRRWILFHGTFLLDFDLPLIGRYLQMPSRQPDYRRDRPHGDFIRNFPASREDVKEALRRTWKADAVRGEIPRETVARLVREQFSRSEWNRRVLPEP